MDNAIPLYQQIYKDLISIINDGVYKAGDKIPAEDELCKKYKVSRVTIRAALKKMVKENIIERIHGKGTFVKSPVFIESTFAQGSFTKSCIQMNIKPSTKLISREKIVADGKISERLKIQEGSTVICVKRLRLTNGIPAIFEVDYFYEDYDFVLTADLEDTPILELIHNNNGLNRKGFIDTFEVHYATEEEGEWLNCPAYSPLLCVRQIISTENNNILYYNEQFIRSDIYKYVIGN